MSLRRLPVTLLLLGIFFPASAQTSDVPVGVATPSSEPAEAVVNHLVGVMDTSAQAAVDPDRVSVQMTTCHVELAENSADAGIYLYQEQALTERLDSPYRQRFLHIIADEEGESVESRTFKPMEAEVWIGLCDRPLAERVIPATAFSPEAFCTVELQPADSGGYVGSTPPEGCPVNLRGAVRLTNTIVLHAAGMDTWDRGFDAAGNQVWGAEDVPYEFRWGDR